MALRRAALILFLAITLISLARPGSTSQLEEAADLLDVVVGEVVWSGMPADFNDEWIELHNNTDADVDLDGWRLFTDVTPDVALTGVIPAGGHYLLERTDDTSVPDRTADQTYTGNLSNSPGEVITLTDALSNVVDVVGLDPSGEWFAGTSSPDRRPMVRVELTASGALATSWATGVISGTPTNSIADADTDTYGYSPNADWTAGDGAGYEVRDEDCDDGDSSVHPGAPEILNLLDDDCDGQVDDGLDLGAFEWSAYFNSDTTIDALGKTSATVAMEQALIGYVDAATETVDVAIYGFDRESLADALIDAHGRGARVRVVGDDDAASGYYSPTYNLVASAGISVVVDSSGRLEHNKFAVFDGRMVWTGSTNWTDTGLTYNANNSIAITSPHLALAYTIEFEEMFGGAFQTGKADNIMHVYSYTKSTVESYFSPTDDVQAKVTEVLSNAEESIYFALFYWTTDEMADLVVSKVLTEGLTVSGVWDAVGARNQYSEDEKLCAAGVPLKVENFGGKVHHKFAVVDVGGDNPAVITGSYNWTASGAEDNDENTLIIYDRAVAQAYYQEYVRLYDAIPDQAVCSNHSAESGLAACQDGSDNDFDGFLDGADWDCRESTPSTCQDEADNDGDGDTDLDDLDCYRCRLTGAQIVGNDRVDAGQTVTLTALPSPTDAAGPLQFDWSEDGLQSAITDTAVYSWPAAGAYQVALTVTTQCRVVTDTFTVTVGGPSFPSITLSDYTVAPTQVISIDVNRHPAGVYELHWIDEDFNTVEVISPALRVGASGSAHVEFTVPEGGPGIHYVETRLQGDMPLARSAAVEVLVPALPDLSIGDVGAIEGDGGTTAAVFSVTLSATAAETVTVGYATADPTGTGQAPATAGVDYVTISGTLTFVPGVVTQPIPVGVLGDTVDEADEVFLVNLADPINAHLDDAQGRGVILDDDDQFYIYLPLVVRAFATSPLEGHTVSGYVVEDPHCVSNYHARGISVALSPTGRTTTTGIMTGLFSFDQVPDGDYTLYISTCAPFGCWPATPVTVAGADVFVRNCPMPHP